MLTIESGQKKKIGFIINVNFFKKKFGKLFLSLDRFEYLKP